MFEDQWISLLLSLTELNNSNNKTIFLVWTEVLDWSELWKYLRKKNLWKWYLFFNLDDLSFEKLPLTVKLLLSFYSLHISFSTDNFKLRLIFPFIFYEFIHSLLSEHRIGVLRSGLQHCSIKWVLQLSFKLGDLLIRCSHLSIRWISQLCDLILIFLLNLHEHLRYRLFSFCFLILSLLLQMSQRSFEFLLSFA